jgi:hypothetical protein
MKQYKYTLLKQDGTTQDMGVSKEKSLDEIYAILGCNMIELIPSDYWRGMGYGKCTMYGDEEGRFVETNHRNPHFRVLFDSAGNPWDVVGNILKKEVYAQ